MWYLTNLSHRSASLQPPKTATGAASGNYVKKDGYDKVDHTEEAYFLKDDDEDDQPAPPQQHTTISPDSIKKSLGSLEFVSGGMLHSNLDTSTPSNQAVKEAAASSDPLPPQIKLVPYEVGSDSSDSEDELSLGVRKRSLQTAGFGSGGSGAGLGGGKRIAINLKSSGSKVAEKNGASSPESSAKRRKLIWMVALLYYYVLLLWGRDRVVDKLTSWIGQIEGIEFLLFFLPNDLLNFCFSTNAKLFQEPLVGLQNNCSLDWYIKRMASMSDFTQIVAKVLFILKDASFWAIVTIPFQDSRPYYE